jgi:hypothetical protein
MIWGGHGANAVHFSILQEYLAARVDVGIGALYQLSNNAHVYVHEYERLMTRRDRIDDITYDAYAKADVSSEAMFTEPSEIDRDIKTIMTWHIDHNCKTPECTNKWFSDTFARAVLAYDNYRASKLDRAIQIASLIEAPDWKRACVEWLQRKDKDHGTR